MTVDLPLPVRPTSATVSPGLTAWMVSLDHIEPVMPMIDTAMPRWATVMPQAERGMRRARPSAPPGSRNSPRRSASSLKVAPTKFGTNTFLATVKDKNGKPVEGASVLLQTTMLDMEMGQQAYALKETAPGVYSHSAPALVMVGHWALTFEVQPPGGQTFDVLLVDKANG